MEKPRWYQRASPEQAALMKPIVDGVLKNDRALYEQGMKNLRKHLGIAEPEDAPLTDCYGERLNA